MNIDDVYYVQIYKVDCIRKKGHFVTDYHATYVRTTLALERKADEDLKYYDLIENKYLNLEMYGTEIGDEVAGNRKNYIKFTDVFPVKRKHLSRNKILKILKEGLNG